MKKSSLQVLFDAMHHGKYDFGSFLRADARSLYEPLLVQKREVFRASKKLRAFHAFLNTFLFEYLDINRRVVFSYRKGTSAQQAVLAHASSRAFFQADIVDFFRSINRELIRTTIARHSSSCPITDVDAHLDRILELTTVGDFLPMGFATSPQISNACLTEFDNDLERACNDSGLIYTRYADDIIVSGQDRDSVSQARLLIEKLLQHHFHGRLALNPLKSKLTTIGRKIKILGMVILPSGQVTIDMALKKKIEVLLHYYVSDRETFLSMSSQDLESGIEQLGGYVSYVNAVDQKYLDKLKRKFGSTVIDSFLHRSAS